MVVDIFLDSPDTEAYKRHKVIISGGTTNPSLMSNMGIANNKYEQHCREILNILDGGVLSVEVTEIDPERMYEQAMRFHKWDDARIVVKIPAPFYIDGNTAQRVDSKFAPGSPVFVDTIPVIARLAGEGVPLNITCGFGYEQAHAIAAAITSGARKAKNPAKNNYFSMFWGRLLDGYVADKSRGFSQVFDRSDTERLIALSMAEVEEAARQLEGSGIRLILGSSRLPKVWEEAAKKEGDDKLMLLKREAFRAVLKVARPFNAVPTVPPALLEASRYHEGTSAALKGFVDEYIKLRDSRDKTFIKQYPVF